MKVNIVDIVGRTICQKTGNCKYINGRCNTTRCTINTKDVQIALRNGLDALGKTQGEIEQFSLDLYRAVYVDKW